MIYYVGDLHGRVEDMMKIDRAAIAAGVSYVVQVGDFGIRWPGKQCSMFKYFEKRSRKIENPPTWITCGGNHENWDKWLTLAYKQGDPDLVELAPGCYYAKRGSVHSIDGIKHLFLGGTESTDKHLRIEGKSWWKEESPVYSDFVLAMENLEKHKPEVLVTHDVPAFVDTLFPARQALPTAKSLENLFTHSEHKPLRWYYGHYHSMLKEKRGDTTFMGCGFHGTYLMYPETPNSSTFIIP